MATLPVTITHTDGSTRTEDGRGNVISRTSAPSKSSSGSKGSSSPGSNSSGPAYSDYRSAGGAKGTGHATYASWKNAQNDIARQAYQEKYGENPRYSSEMKTAYSLTQAQYNSQTRAGNLPNQPARALPPGAHRIGNSRIKYKGATYNEQTFYDMQARGQQTGIYDAPNKAELVYKSKISGIIQDEQGYYDPTSGKLTLFAPEGSSTYNYIAEVIKDTPGKWDAVESDGGFIIQEGGFTELRLSPSQIKVNEGTVSSKPGHVDLTPLGPVISTPLPSSGASKGTLSGSIRQQEAELNKMVDDFAPLQLLKEGAAGLANSLNSPIVQKAFSQLEPIKGTPIVKPFMQNTLKSFGSMPGEAVKLTLTSGLKLNALRDSPLASFEASRVIAEDLGAVGSFAGHQALWLASSARIDPVGTAGGVALWAGTEMLPTMVSATAWTGALAGAGQWASKRMPVQTSSTNVNVVRAQMIKDGKSYTVGDSFAKVTSKHPLSQSQTANYYGQWEQYSTPMEKITGPVSGQWTAQGVGTSKGIIGIGGKSYPTSGQYFISPEIATPAQIIPKGGGWGVLPATTGNRAVSSTFIFTTEGVKGSVWAGDVFAADMVPTVTKTGISKLPSFPIEGAKAYESFGYASGASQGATYSLSYTWTPPNLIPGLGGEMLKGASGAVGGGGAGAGTQLIMRTTSPMGLTQSATNLMKSLTEQAAVSQGSTVGMNIGANFGQAMGNVASIGVIAKSTTRSFQIGMPQTMKPTLQRTSGVPLTFMKAEVKPRGPESVYFPGMDQLISPFVSTQTRQGGATIPRQKTKVEPKITLGTPQISLTTPLTITKQTQQIGFDIPDLPRWRAPGQPKTPPPTPFMDVPPLTFGGGFGLGGFPDFGGSMFGGGNQPKGYAPSLGAIFTGSTTKKAPKGLVGLQMRPIVSGKKSKLPKWGSIL